MMIDRSANNRIETRPTAAHADAMLVREIKNAVLSRLTLTIGKDVAEATARDWYLAAALALRDRIAPSWQRSRRAVEQAAMKRVYYLSLEFLIGRLFTDAASNLRLYGAFCAALRELGTDLDTLRALEPDAALGNGGLGRLAACFMESMATLEIPAIGYGIRYEHGLFRQVIADGQQQEFPEQWLTSGNPWEFERPEATYRVRFGGFVSEAGDTATWQPAETVLAVAYDTPIVGFDSGCVNALRLWSARPPDPLNIGRFNEGDHLGAMSESARAAAISKFLYPSDETEAGRELRLKQEYFFVSASLQDIIQRHLSSGEELSTLPARAAIQLNDTHPALAVPELMRLLVDCHRLRWENAWTIVQNTIAYTNHTLLPEALETWSLNLVEKLLPRHLDIIHRINDEHLARAHDHAPHDMRYRASVSLIDETGERRVRMGPLAFIGSHRINGVSAIHSDLVRRNLFADLDALYPGRIVNKTNGITFRRWLHQCNPALTDLLREVCGENVLSDPSHLRELEKLADNPRFQDRFLDIKRQNKIALASTIEQRLDIRIDPGAMFDVQIKRIHEYKRQLLNAIETAALYLAMKDEPNRDWTPRVKIFAGKAAASYQRAKLIIRLINDIAATVNDDPDIRGRLKVIFFPNYNVSAAEMIVPASDLSEQISTAGMEASGTGNMKLALNGSITIGTLDGANVEIRDHVGHDNIFIFGLDTDEVLARRRQGLDAMSTIEASPLLKRAIAAIDSGIFSGGEARFASITHALRHDDYYLVCSDFESYFSMQRHLDVLWATPEWTRKAILNVARMAWFSADRTIRDYAHDIWHIPVTD